MDTRDLNALADAAESLARRRAAPAGLGVLLGELSERGVGIRVLDDGPDGDGVVARWIVGPVARDVARWAAGRQLAPAALLGISLGLALLAATWFSEPATRAQVLASVALLVSFTAARAADPADRHRTAQPGRRLAGRGGRDAHRVRGPGRPRRQLRADPGTPNDPVGLDGIFGGSLRNTLVATWGGGGQVGVWRLAVAVMLLFGARRLAEECYEGVARASGKILPRPHRRLIGQVITLPAGERVVVIAVTAVCFGPRLTFLVLLAWGAVAAGYVLASQLAAAAKLAAAGKLERARGVLPAYRGDGPIAHWIGGVVRGQLPPLPPLLVGLLVTCDLVVLGVADLSGAADLRTGDGAAAGRAGRPPPARRAAGLAGAGAAADRRGRLPDRPRARPPRLAAGDLRAAGRGGAAARRPRLPGPGPAGASRTTSTAWAGTGGYCWPGSPPCSASCRSPTRCWPPGSGCWPAGTSSAAGSTPRTRSTCRRRRPAWPRSRTSSRRWPGTAWPAPPRPAPRAGPAG